MKRHCGRETRLYITLILMFTLCSPTRYAVILIYLWIYLFSFVLLHFLYQPKESELESCVQLKGTLSAHWIHYENWQFTVYKYVIHIALRFLLDASGDWTESVMWLLWSNRGECFLEMSVFCLSELKKIFFKGKKMRFKERAFQVF